MAAVSPPERTQCAVYSSKTQWGKVTKYKVLVTQVVRQGEASGIVPVGRPPGHWRGSVDIARGSLPGRRVHTEQWSGWRGGEPSCPIPDLPNARTDLTVRRNVSSCQYASSDIVAYLSRRSRRPWSSTPGSYCCKQ